jgi:hypothetical protein
VCAGTTSVACFGTRNYVEYLPGDLPIVVSVPHGGALTPASIPDRTAGTTVTDTNTIELGRAVRDAFASGTGRTPHLIVMHLRRTKVDANREVVEAAQGNAEAQLAWTEYHQFIEQAIGLARATGGDGFYLDLHGHGHAKARLELGYRLSAATLNGSDADLDNAQVALASSLRVAAQKTTHGSASLLRGALSLGGLLAPALPAVPSPADPSPGSDPYFTGGYSTERHTVVIAGAQIESHYPGVRDSVSSRAAFGAALVTAIRAFVKEHLGLQI